MARIRKSVRFYWIFYDFWPNLDEFLWNLVLDPMDFLQGTLRTMYWEYFDTLVFTPKFWHRPIFGILKDTYLRKSHILSEFFFDAKSIPWIQWANINKKYVYFHIP